MIPVRGIGVPARGSSKWIFRNKREAEECSVALEGVSLNSLRRGNLKIVRGAVQTVGWGRSALGFRVAGIASVGQGSCNPAVSLVEGDRLGT